MPLLKKPICNPLECRTRELIELLLKDDNLNFHQQQTLKNFLNLENEYLDKECFSMFNSGSIDLLICDKVNNPILAIEKQSKWHDSEEAIKRDRIKWKLCSLANLKIVYVREKDGYLYFWTYSNGNKKKGVQYNLYTQEGKDNLICFLHYYLFHLVNNYRSSKKKPILLVA